MIESYDTGFIQEFVKRVVTGEIPGKTLTLKVKAFEKSSKPLINIFMEYYPNAAKELGKDLLKQIYGSEKKIPGAVLVGIDPVYMKNYVSGILSGDDDQSDYSEFRVCLRRAFGQRG